MKRALVTGGAGFIGSHVADRFLSQGYEVTILDDLSTGKRQNVPAKAKLVVADVRTPEAAKLVSDGRFDVIAHLAAQIDVRKSVADPMRDAQINIVGALNLFEAARALPKEQWPRIVFASTGGALYGTWASFPTAEDESPNPDSPYGTAKMSVELYLAYYARVWGMNTVVVRFGNVYGPRQDPHGEAGVIAIFAKAIQEGRSLTVFGDGKQTRDYVFVVDVADAFIAATNLEPLPPGPLDARAFNIGTGEETSVLELIETLSDVTGRSPEVAFKPKREGELDRSLLDVAKAERVLEWKARVGLREGLERTLAWMSEVTGVGRPVANPGG